MPLDFGNMPVPGASSFLGLPDQVKQETDEERKRRMQAMSLGQRSGMGMPGASTFLNPGYGAAGFGG
jgi:hypothetical protein